MAKYIFAYHGGKMPDTPEEGKRVMAAWGAWYEGMGDKLADGGGPAGKSSTVTPNGVDANGGSNPISGYTVVSADSQDEATEIAKGCPILGDGGTVEVAELMEM
ncbi:MAG: YciI family protein [Paracoccaceae bacterium]